MHVFFFHLTFKNDWIPYDGSWWTSKRRFGLKCCDFLYPFQIYRIFENFWPFLFNWRSFLRLFHADSIKKWHREWHITEIDPFDLFDRLDRVCRSEDLSFCTKIAKDYQKSPKIPKKSRKSPKIAKNVERNFTFSTGGIKNYCCDSF